MRLAAMVLGAGVLVFCGGAAAPPPPSSTTETTFFSAAELDALIDKTKAGRRPGQVNVPATLFRVPPTNVNVEFRPEPGPAAIHPSMAELFVVLQGSGELTSGGTIVRPEAAPGAAAPPASITGGTTRKVAKGDVFLVPANLPHAFTQSDGQLVIMQTYLRLPEGGAPTP
jgi:mannose-6-phosphate isomerase-like protein (cupin superfamily)